MKGAAERYDVGVVLPEHLDHAVDARDIDERLVSLDVDDDLELFAMHRFEHWQRSGNTVGSRRKLGRCADHCCAERAHMFLDPFVISRYRDERSVTRAGDSLVYALDHRAASNEREGFRRKSSRSVTGGNHDGSIHRLRFYNPIRVSTERVERNRFVVRWGFGILWLLTGVAAVSHVSTFFNDKFSRTTGAANWIWDRESLSRAKPRAFFVTRDFDLPADRRYVHVKVAADPEYTLYFNGREVGGYRGGDPLRLDVYDVSSFAHDRANRIVIAVRSRTGAGGLIVSVDLAPNQENMLVSDESWRIQTRWSDSLLSADEAGAPAPARVLGRPSFGKWNYLPEEKRPLRKTEYKQLEPLDEVSLRSSVP